MAETKIIPSHWDLLIERIDNHLCVPFLGAGVNASREDYEGLPTCEEVCLRFIEKLLGLKCSDLKELVQVIPSYASLADYKELIKIELQNLARVALLFEFHTDSKHLMSLLKKSIPDEKRGPSKLLLTLANLPFKLILTTNYDRLMEKALEKKQRTYFRITQSIDGFDEIEKDYLTKKLAAFDDIILYKIHGSFNGNYLTLEKSDKQKVSRVIITEEDYIKFLSIIGKEDNGIPNIIIDKFKTSTLLFLGYSLADWDFRTLYKGLIEPLDIEDKLKSFAIQKDPSEFWVKFWEKKDVIIYNIDLNDFAIELNERYQRYLNEKD